MKWSLSKDQNVFRFVLISIVNHVGFPHKKCNAKKLHKIEIFFSTHLPRKEFKALSTLAHDRMWQQNLMD
jgi:hypothetical protein